MTESWVHILSLARELGTGFLPWGSLWGYYGWGVSISELILRGMKGYRFSSDFVAVPQARAAQLTPSPEPAAKLLSQARTFFYGGS